MPSRSAGWIERYGTESGRAMLSARRYQLVWPGRSNRRARAPIRAAPAADEPPRIPSAFGTGELTGLAGTGVSVGIGVGVRATVGVVPAGIGVGVRVTVG